MSSQKDFIVIEMGFLQDHIKIMLIVANLNMIVNNIRGGWGWGVERVDLVQI